MNNDLPVLTPMNQHENYWCQGMRKWRISIFWPSLIILMIYFMTNEDRLRVHLVPAFTATVEKCTHPSLPHRFKAEY